MEKYENNRKYNIRKTLRFNNAQWQMILERMNRCKIKDFNNYARKMLIDGYVLVIDDSKELKNFTYEINKIGNNINQIAYALNSQKTVSKETIDELKDMMVSIWQYQRYILSGTPF